MTTKEIPNNLFFNNIRNIISSGNSVELKVKGTSMQPTLLDGKHRVVLVPYKKQYLRTGMIALFVYRGKYVLHRLVAIDNYRLTFQGDNLPYTKEYIKEEDIVAIVEFIITPTSKVIDCKKRWFFIKTKLDLLIYRFLAFMRKIKAFLLRTIISGNRTISLYK